MPKKALSGLKISEADDGTVTALFSTLNVIDHDQDVTLPGAFTDGQKVRISAYNHASWGPGALPVGKGQINEDGDSAIFDGGFFMNTTAGRDTFETVKELGDLGEWSYGYDILDSAPGQQDGQDVLYLKKLDVHEVSPVLLGAGIGTRTLSAKGLHTPPLLPCPECRSLMDPILDHEGKIKSAVCGACRHVSRYDRRGKQLDSNIEAQLCDAGRTRFGNSTTYVYLVDHDDDSGFAIFELWGQDEDRTIQVNYTRADGNVILQSGEQDVQAQVSYTPKGTTPEAAKTTAPEPDGDGDAGMKLTDHLDLVLQKAGEVTSRLADVKAMRAEKGKSLSDDTMVKATGLADELDTHSKALREVLTSADPEQPDPTAPADENGLTLEDEAATAEAAARIALSL